MHAYTHTYIQTVVLDDALLVLCSASRLQHIYQAMDALIFPKDKVEIQDLTLALARFHLVGPKASALVATAPVFKSRILHS